MIDTFVETNTEITDSQLLVFRASKMKLLRDRILNDTVDKVNPVRYAALTGDQQAELATYRQALLDVPQQAGFPTDIQWPEKPAWL